MDWTAAVDGYCERLGPGLWAEPINALSNLAFLVAALICWRRAADTTGRVLAVALAAIGLASGLFHTHAVAWAGAADSLAIAVFTVLYLFVAVRDFLRIGGAGAVALTGLFLLATSLATALLGALLPLGANAAYIAIALLIAGFGLALLPRPGRGLLAAATLLGLSITARMLDMPLCDRLPSGTHWIWHGLNAVVLGGVIEVRRRYLAGSTAGR
ncbi:membrane protein, putative [Oceanicola granulosus HTCC2516]|uniref:Membrane protein, putative n=1 Tax=Oceanicola granulosus (strain ATCC BAA-861 / DSM 15982 / KCTC 12143 / HTCC2516) TaxID=314256 RepID=Q2CFB4_OCEGH|nr:ceramidase domain-containing protein [Oceanicola granulosus]EAR51381.1 membrane protein, putative [Oceanicola granulosus HTCC2516]